MLYVRFVLDPVRLGLNGKVIKKKNYTVFALNLH